MRLKGLTSITPINSWLLNIYSTIFLNEFLVYLRLIIFQEPSILLEFKIAMGTLAQNLE